MRGYRLASQRRLRQLLGACLAAFLVTLSGPSSSQTQTVVEYLHVGWGHYFITSFPNEIAYLDDGAFGGAFQRTGRTFTAWSAQVPDSSPVCRFFTVAFAPRGSHFYTPLAAECEVLKLNANWQFESISFYLKTPDSAGNCPAGSSPLYRLYNDGSSGAPNHRYTDSQIESYRMERFGWRPEGRVGCVPSTSAPAPTPTGPAGLYFGSSTFSETIRGVVLPEGTFYVIYSIPGSNLIAGAVQGSGTFANGWFGSSNAREFPVRSGAVDAAISGSYVPGVNIHGSFMGAYDGQNFSAGYLPGSQNPPNLAAAAGTYVGTVVSSRGSQPATFSLTEAGGLSGSSVGCTFAGTASPHPGVSAFDLTVRFNGGLCLLGTATFAGVAVHDSDVGQMFGAALDASRTDGLVFTGTRSW